MMEFIHLPHTWNQRTAVLKEDLWEWNAAQATAQNPNPYVRTRPVPTETSPTSRTLSQVEIAARFKARLQLLKKTCKGYSESLRPKLWKTKIVHIPASGSLLSDVTYCVIPKTGSTTWTILLKSIQAKVKKIITTSSGLLEDKRNISFTFIREPYSRLLSAYVDKLFTPNWLFSVKTGRYIIKNFRPSASSLSLHCGLNVTFPEYIQYFIHMQKTGIKREEHFIPAHEECQLCDYPYTYIGHLETIKEDMPFILKAINSPVSYNKVFDNVTILSNSRMALLTTRNRLQDCMGLDEVSRRLWKKLQIRGVISRSLAFPFTREETQNISLRRMQEAGLAALAQSGPRSTRIGQKKEALREAFASIPLDVRLEVKNLLFPGFEMFGFDPEPDEVFPATPYKPDPHFSYFDPYG